MSSKSTTATATAIATTATTTTTAATMKTTTKKSASSSGKRKATTGPVESSSSSSSSVAAADDTAIAAAAIAAASSGAGEFTLFDEVYTKKTLHAHIEDRPDTYIGAVHQVTERMWTIDNGGHAVLRNVTFVPGMLKIFDEILVNAADNQQRDPKGTTQLRVAVNAASGIISVWNNGASLPLLKHGEHGCYIPQMCFGELLTGSNYNDQQKRTVGGRNGFGSKLTNIYSAAFSVECRNHQQQLCYTQHWRNRMHDVSPPLLKSSGKVGKLGDYTKVTFTPYFAAFEGMAATGITDDLLQIMRHRVYMVAGTTPTSLRVFWNDVRVPISDFRALAALYFSSSDNANVAAAAAVDVASDVDAAAAAAAAADGDVGDTDEVMPAVDEDEDDSGGGSSSSSSSSSSTTTLVAEAEKQFVYKRFSNRLEVVIGCSPDGHFLHVSSVNNIYTYKGGTHVRCIVDQIVRYLKSSAKGLSAEHRDLLTPKRVTQQLFVMINILVDNPTFEAQEKSCLTLPVKMYGEAAAVCVALPETWLRDVYKSLPAFRNAIESVAVGREQQQEQKIGGRKTRRLIIDKLSDADDAGTRHSAQCTLILTEGDSAKALAMAGLKVVGGKQYGVFPMRGKQLNVRGVSFVKMMQNPTINSIVQIMGLRAGVAYESEAEVRQLRYGHIMIMADQDVDGSHIKGLVLNMFQHVWPALFRRPGFLRQFITPLLKVTFGQQQQMDRPMFFSMLEFKQWEREQQQQPGGKKRYTIKYYKGLGTSTNAEAVQYFSDLPRHLIEFRYSGTPCDDAMDLVFNKKRADDRKEWFSACLKSAAAAAAAGQPPPFSNSKSSKMASAADAAAAVKKQSSTAAAAATLKQDVYCDFVNRDMSVFGLESIDRAIPHLMDGLKPVQRKVVYGCMNLGGGSGNGLLSKEFKVSQLAGIIGDRYAYHHGETSLNETIVRMAQRFVGSGNNINLLQPIGQFGTRAENGKDFASPRYIFTKMSSVTPHLFPPQDLPLLKCVEVDGELVEPQWFATTIPMSLVNGAQGIAMGWSTFVPSYNPLDMIAHVRHRLLQPPQSAASLASASTSSVLKPWYRGFQGSIELQDAAWACWGVIDWVGGATADGAVADSSNTSTSLVAVVKELPPGTSNEKFMACLQGLVTAEVLSDFSECHQQQAAAVGLFRLVFASEQQYQRVSAMSRSQLNELFGGQFCKTLPTTNMVLYSPVEHALKRYSTADEIMDEFMTVRMPMYEQRRQLMIRDAGSRCSVIEMRMRFIRAVVDNVLLLNRRPFVDVVADMQRLNIINLDDAYAGAAAAYAAAAAADVDGVDDAAATVVVGVDAAVGERARELLKTPLMSLTEEAVQRLEMELAKQKSALVELHGTNAIRMWLADLEALENALIVHEREMELLEAADTDSADSKKKKQKTVVGGGGNANKKARQSK